MATLNGMQDAWEQPPEDGPDEEELSGYPYDHEPGNKRCRCDTCEADAAHAYEMARLDERVFGVDCL